MKTTMFTILSLVLCAALVTGCSGSGPPAYARADETPAASSEALAAPGTSGTQETARPREDIQVARYAFAEMKTPVADERNVVGITLAEFTYRADTMEGLASVTDTVVIGTFRDIESSVVFVNGSSSIQTTATLIPSESLFGQNLPYYRVTMAGGTVSYRAVGDLYTEGELGKYGMDPDNPELDTYSNYFELMQPIDEDVTYLVTMASGSDGTFTILPGLYSLCRMAEEDEGGPEPPAGKEAERFNIDEYLRWFYDRGLRSQPPRG